MKARILLPALSLVLLSSGPAFAQDPVKVAAAHYTVVLENASVRVLKANVAPGAKTAMHAHPDSLVIPLGAAKVRFTMADGKSEESDLASESAMYTPAHTHSGENIGQTGAEVLIVEFKTPAAGTATVPSARDNMAMKMLAEGPRAVVYRATAEPTFSEPAGTKHDYDQIVIALGDSQMSLAVGGKAAKTSWKRGDVQFIERGGPHESKNTGGRPVDFIIVAIR
jgi:mannose-6-phosphate isomerase-like protein (cupin superfamily)